VIALNVGCVGLPGLAEFLAWGFSDDCLRVCTLNHSDGPVAPERRVLVREDGGAGDDDDDDEEEEAKCDDGGDDDDDNDDDHIGIAVMRRRRTVMMMIVMTTIITATTRRSLAPLTLLLSPLVRRLIRWTALAPSRPWP
jgi:hypothetical protein